MRCQKLLDLTMYFSLKEVSNFKVVSMDFLLEYWKIKLFYIHLLEMFTCRHYKEIVTQFTKMICKNLVLFYDIDGPNDFNSTF